MENTNIGTIGNKTDSYNNNYIYTIEDKCVGCNKCVRGCPAIYANVAYMKDGEIKIKVDQEKCIRCGHCLEQCDHGARDYRDDTEYFFKDLEAGEKISIIAAPAVRFNFDNHRALFGYLKRIGINLIYDVSFGADICTWAYLKAIKELNLDSVIAQPCPAIVDYIEKYKPSLIEKLAPIHSPALCTAIYLRKQVKSDDKIAFLSPCIGKIQEFHDKNTQGMVSYNLTFKKLKDYILRNKIHLRGCDEIEFDDLGCGLGLTFSRPGGLKENVLYHNPEAWVRQIEGSEYAYNYLENYEKRLNNKEKLPLLVDVLNCAHGCNLGTATCKDIGIDDVDSKMESLKSDKIDGLKSKNKGFFKKNKQSYPLFDYFDKTLKLIDYKREYDNKAHLIQIEEPTPSHSDAIYLSLHKETKESREINCYACGYGSCQKLVRAIFNKANHKENCINYNREEVEIEKRDLVDARDAAEQAGKTRSEFLANMSHEIRTPMNGIVGYIQLLSETELTEEQEDYANEASKSADLLLYLINDILDFSKIESGKMTMECIDFNLRSVIEDVATLATSLAYKKGIEVNALINSEIPSKVKGDPGRLKQVLNNLVGNSVKFTKEGEVLIKVKKGYEADGTIEILFEVSDTGIGIPEKAQETIFDAFIQADASATRKFGGTGLGLAISKNIIELMEGKISLKSNVGIGSTFSFNAKFKTVEQSDDMPDRTLRSLKNTQILVVDDNRTNLNIARHYLESVDCRVSVAISAEEALSELELSNIKSDVIIVDYQMPEKDGFSLARILKADDRYKDIPLVMLSSIASKGENALAREIGFSGYLTKPVKKEDLIKCLSMILSNKNNENAPKTMHRVAPKQVITKHVLKENNYYNKFKILLAEDNLTNQKLTVKILSKLSLNCDIASNGAEAVEAYNSRNYDLILMDCQMPEMDGYQATQRIRHIENTNGKNKHIPIIAITANAMAGDAEKCLNAGMDNYLSKPIDKTKLIDIISEYFSLKTVEKETPAGIVSTLEINSDAEYFESIVTDVIQALEFSREEAIDILKDFIESVPGLIKNLKNAIDKEDYNDISYICHTLKGSSSNLRIDKLKDNFIMLETAAENQDIRKCKQIFNIVIRHLKLLKDYM